MLMSTSLIGTSIISCADSEETERLLGDSLLEGKIGETRIEQLLELCDKNVELFPTLTLQYANEIVELGESLSLEEHTADGYNYIGYAYYNNDEINKALYNFQLAYNISIKIDYIHGHAFSKNGYGLVAYAMGDYNSSMKFFDESLEQYTMAGDLFGKGLGLGNKGAVYESLGSYDKAVDHYLEALRLFEEIDNQEEIANISLNIGHVNGQMDNLEQTLEYYSRAMEIYKSIDYDLGIAIASNNLADFLKTIGNYEEAHKSYLNALTIYSEYNKLDEIAAVLNNLGYIFETSGQLEEALEFYNNALDICQTTGNMESCIIYFNNIGSVYHKLGNYDYAIDNHYTALKTAERLSNGRGLESSLRNLAIDYKAIGNLEESNNYYAQYAEIKDALHSQESYKQFANSEVVYETEKKDAQIIEQKEDIIRRQRRNIILLIGIVISLIVLIVVSILGAIISKERKKSDKLLLNILPARVAKELKDTGKTTPESFENVTVYFSDIVSFTKTSAKLDPEFLINELSDIFTTFDNIMELHQCERIKTIGDAYFAVCGLPAPDENHAENIINSSMEILDALHKRNENSEIQWRIRIGVHTGKVTGGVVGVKKYIYDVFGDTINTASRMESNSEPMRINVSEETFSLVSDKYKFIKRDPLEVKGKGVFQMYFLDI